MSSKGNITNILRGRSDRREGNGTTRAEAEETWPVVGGGKEKAFLKEFFNDTNLPYEIRKISSNLSLYLKELKTEEINPKVSRRREMIKIRV